MENKQNILVVDDDRSLVLITQRILQKEGFEVITTFDGLEALHKAREEKPDLIILDIVMPEMNGYEVARQLQADPDTACIPIIFMSVKGIIDETKGATAIGLNEVDEAYSSGACNFLNKPVAAEDLLCAVKNALWLCSLRKVSKDCVGAREGRW